MKFNSKIVHGGKYDIKRHYGASSVPIYQNSTFTQEDPAHQAQYDYSRSGNPTREALETAIAELEGGSAGFAFASGMAASCSVLMLFRPGDHIIVSTDVYGGTFRALSKLFKDWGLESSFADSTERGAMEAAIRPNTKAFFIETPSNPLLRISDLSELVKLAKKHGAVTIADNTFMTPLLQRPLELGFDIVVHSATKFIGGHSDLIAGLAAVRDTELAKQLKFVQNCFGAILAPHDSWLTLRGLKSLGARMEVQQRSAERLAAFLSKMPEIKAVWHPSLPKHPGRETHFRQASGSGAVLSFELENQERTLAFLKALKLPLFAVSLGGVESIASYPAMMSHAAMPPEERKARGITDSLVRFSVGLEDPEDLEKDIVQALEKL
ncbi:MAG: cystathionine gamma-synthase [Lentisphaerae bacterium GWF2_52_8]|nr:MAG: cystathionine gamma-synthase [Lentisphaerae bacterium GWF2_52_8]